MQLSTSLTINRGVRKAPLPVADIQGSYKKAKPHRTNAFGPPKAWVQTMYADGTERFDGFDGTEKAIKTLGACLVQLEEVDAVLVFDGDVSLNNLIELTTEQTWCEMRTDYRDDGQKLIAASEIPTVSPRQ